MKIRWLVLLCLGAFLWTVILHAPANRLYAALVAAQPASVLNIHGVRGTISSGAASALSLNQRPMLRDLEWNLRPAWLALLRLKADIRTQGDLNMRMTVSRAVFGRLRISDLEAVSSVKGLLAASGLPPLPVEGQVRLAIDSAQFDQSLPVQIEGLVEIQGLSWTLARDPIALGDFNVNLTTEDKVLLAQLASGAGPVELSGEARLLPDRRWELKLQVKPRPDASPQMLALVRSLGDPDSAGWYHLRRQGAL